MTVEPFPLAMNHREWIRRALDMGDDPVFPVWLDSSQTGQGRVAETIRRKLDQALAPTRLEVVDDSDKHAGHAGAREGGESHFTVTVQSAAFAGLGRVERQRLVNSLLAEELAGPIHALSIRALAPGE